MKHIPIILSTCLLATSTFALEAGQSAFPPSENPPAPSEPKKGTDAKGADIKETSIVPHTRAARRQIFCGPAIRLSLEPVGDASRASSFPTRQLRASGEEKKWSLT